ncbi:GNAT family N-acetyltransferase [Methylocapsa sp. S129]|uniref:GNAT family N-acetyltransferase n=1 Tax=Methylocapsa sp. S129 TaxID=1641869 RepID=UPI00131CAF57|nr:GNAT family N-acetyltransferase [Methylocapsa sp. S129]
MSSLSIRPAKLNDLDAILALELAVFATDRLSRRSLRAFIASPHRPLLVAISDEGLAGYALVALRKRAAAARLYSIAVDQRSGRRGIGRALMAACEHYAAAHGRRALRLEVRSDNQPAIALYERLGFRQFGHYDNYYADGARALRFEKSLAAAASPAQS